jgi:hypothetical protein
MTPSETRALHALSVVNVRNESAFALPVIRPAVKAADKGPGGYRQSCRRFRSGERRALSVPLGLRTLQFPGALEAAFKIELVRNAFCAVFV